MTDYIPHTVGLCDRGLQSKFVPLNKRTDEVTIGGGETFYSSECTTECESCRKNLRVEANFEYGDGWILLTRLFG